MQLDTGRWKVLLFPQPLDFNITTNYIHTISTPIPGSFLYMRMYDAAEFNIFSFEHLDLPTDDASYQIKKYTSTQMPRYTNSDTFKIATSNNQKRSIGQGSPMGVLRSVQEIFTTYLPMKSISSYIPDEFKAKAQEAKQKAIYAQTIRYRELVARAKTFNVGVSLRDFTWGDIVNPFIRVNVIDNTTDDANLGFSTPIAELSTENQVYGWEGGCFKDYMNMPALEGRKLTFDLYTDNNFATEAVGYSEVDLFTFQDDDETDINLGVHRIELMIISPKIGEDQKRYISVQIYDASQKRPLRRRLEARLIPAPFPKNTWTPIENKPLQTYNGQQIKIVVDGARFLPANVTVTRVVGNLFNYKAKPVTRVPDMVSDIFIDNPIYTPRFNCTTKYSLIDVDYTSAFYFRIYTIDRISRRRRLVGTSYLSLFIDPKTNMPPVVQTSNQKMEIRSGAFQIPIYYGSPKANEISKKEFSNMARVPCATLLLRIFLWSSKDPEPEPTPVSYESNIYQSELSDPLRYEELIYPIIEKERKPIPTKTCIIKTLKDIPRNALNNDEVLNAWINKAISVRMGDMLELIDRSHACMYDPSYGFRMSIDRGLNFPNKGVSIAIVSFYPPGSLYDTSQGKDGIKLDENGLFDDIVLTEMFDWTSQYRHPAWNDGYHWYRNRRLEPLLAIIHIVCLSYQDGKWRTSNQGWTVLPIFDNGNVNMGSYQLPLYDSKPTKQVLSIFDEISRSYNAETDHLPYDEILDNAFVAAKVNYSNGASLFVRLADGRRGDELQRTGESSVLVYTGTDKAQFNSRGSSPILSSLVPKKMTQVDFHTLLIYSFLDSQPHLSRYA